MIEILYMTITTAQACTPVKIDLATILKTASVALGFFSPFLVAFVLKDKTHEHAIQTRMLRERSSDRESHDKLDMVVEWRDLIVLAFSGVLLLLFSAADKSTSSCASTALMAETVTYFLVPISFLLAFLLAIKVNIVLFTSRWKYLLLYAPIMLLYVTAFYMIYLP